MSEVGLTVWLSFATDETFGGLVIVDVEDDNKEDEILMLDAVRKTILLNINPGPKYQVVGRVVRCINVADQFKNRLLSREEAEMVEQGPGLKGRA